MARPLRIEYSGAVYHVTSRGNAKKPIFRDDKDRYKFLETLESVIKRHNWLCHTYCLMDNHYHIIIETPDGNLSKGMRQLNGVYTQAFNRRHKRVGHVFQGRYKAILIEKESYLLELCRYVVLNPVRAGIVKKAGDWRWSSYNSIAGITKAPQYLTVDRILGHFGSNRKEAEKNYRDIVRAGIEKGSPWENLKGQILLGSEGFIEKFKDILSKKEDIREIPKVQRYLSRPRIDEIMKKESIKDKRARNKQIHEAITQFGYSLKEISDYLKMHYTTVSKALKEAEFKN